MKKIILGAATMLTLFSSCKNETTENHNSIQLTHTLDENALNDDDSDTDLAAETKASDLHNALSDMTAIAMQDTTTFLVATKQDTLRLTLKSNAGDGEYNSIYNFSLNQSDMSRTQIEIGCGLGDAPNMARRYFIPLTEEATTLPAASGLTRPETFHGSDAVIRWYPVKTEKIVVMPQ